MSIPTVCILGRPNVGKSSLFNRIIGRRTSVTQREAGTTRDRVEKTVALDERPVRFVDTGGFLTHDKDRITALVREQIKKALQYSDIILFVVDCIDGITAQDMDLVSTLRKCGKKVFLVVNKVDNESREGDVPAFFQLGLGDPHPISCAHNAGISSLKELISERVKEIYEETTEHKISPIKIAILGRPNVGKSSLLNKLLNEERVIVDERPGTTRDAIDTYFKEGGTDFMLIDTAGIKHRRKVKEPVEAYSMMRSKEAIKRCDLALVLVDGMEGVTNDDARIMELVIDEGKGCIICVNKWDLVKNIPMASYKNAVVRKMPAARDLPVIFISAKTGRGIFGTIEKARMVKTNLDLSMDREDLEGMLAEIKPEVLPVPSGRKAPRFYGMSLVKVEPKTFLIFVNDPRRTLKAHTNFIINNLRKRFPLEGVPLRIIYKRKTKG